MKELTKEEKEQKIEAIMFEARQHGLAFVSDEFSDFSDDDDGYLPDVDFETADAWLRSTLAELIK